MIEAEELVGGEWAERYRLNPLARWLSDRRKAMPAR